MNVGNRNNHPPRADHAAMIGRRFGRLVVISYSHNNKKKSACYLCRCDCGTEKIAVGQWLRSGLVLSCGCLHREILNRIHTTHGASHTRLFRIWASMRQRCRPSGSGTKNHGARGIRICKEWDNYIAFQEWALSHGYAEDLTIDRIDNDGNYEPSNCHWIPLSENNQKANLERWAKWRNARVS